jgi:hypothetical protein
MVFNKFAAASPKLISKTGPTQERHMAVATFKLEFCRSDLKFKKDEPKPFDKKGIRSRDGSSTSEKESSIAPSM